MVGYEYKSVRVYGCRSLLFSPLTLIPIHSYLFMTKNELIEKVSKKGNLTKSAAADAVNSAFGIIRDSLVRGEKVVITGFGTFMVRSRAERRGRNPQTGETIKIPAKKLPGFTAGKTIKRLIK